jgi:hypothetical protein
MVGVADFVGAVAAEAAIVPMTMNRATIIAMNRVFFMPFSFPFTPYRPHGDEILQAA